MNRAEQWYDRWSDWIFDRLDIWNQGADLKLRKEAKPRILQAMRGERDETDRLMNSGRFALEVQEALELAKFPAPEFELLRDTWDFSTAISNGYVSWKSQQNDVSFRRAPAWQLIAAYSDCHEDEWHGRWLEMGGQFVGGGKMIALKTDEIWRRLSYFGLPWTPFKIGCGMMLRSVRWREAIEMGLELIEQQPETGWWDLDP